MVVIHKTLAPSTSFERFKVACKTSLTKSAPRFHLNDFYNVSGFSETLFRVQIRDDVLDVDGRIHQAWVVPTVFNPIRFFCIVHDF